ncbi:hypothetical protein ACFQS7_22800 [Dankookia sp. GCM10030260]|uniref:hypothetical protein n=1 Tax=Dankookia sp. GCM10030260 TaxID=3273390 RepID=UPI00361799A4
MLPDRVALSSPSCTSMQVSWPANRAGVASTLAAACDARVIAPVHVVVGVELDHHATLQMKIY